MRLQYFLSTIIRTPSSNKLYKGCDDVKKTVKGFSLIEILVVLSIAAVLGTGLSKIIGKTTKNSDVASITSDKTLLKSRIESHLNKVGEYPFLPNPITGYKNGETPMFLENTDKVLTKWNNKQYIADKDNYLNERFKVVDKDRLKSGGYISKLVNEKYAFFYDMNTGNVLYAKDTIEDLELALDDGFNLKDMRKIKVIYEIDDKKMIKRNTALTVGNTTYVGGQGSLIFLKVNEVNSKITKTDLVHLLPADAAEVITIQKDTGNKLVIEYRDTNDQVSVISVTD